MNTSALTFKREQKHVPEWDWPKLTGEGKAIQYACEHSGMQDKSIAIEANVDNAVLSNAKIAKARLPFDALHALMDATGCEAPLYAHLLRRGYDPRSLRKLETETERERREALEALQREREKTALLTELLQGRPA